MNKSKMEKEESAGVMFPELTFDEARQMCYIAYYGENYGSSIPSYLKKFRKTRKNYDETVQKLQQLGYLKTSSSAAPDHHLDILDFLATVHSDWLNTFKSFRRFTPTHACQYLWQLAGEDVARKQRLLLLLQLSISYWHSTLPKSSKKQLRFLRDLLEPSYISAEYETLLRRIA